MDNQNKKKCKVSQSNCTSNPVLKEWFNDKSISPNVLIEKSKDEKIKSGLKLSYQIPEDGMKTCGRSFEDAFILANQDLFDVPSGPDEKKACFAYHKSQSINKTDFAFKYSLENEEWTVPKYIKEGLAWLVSCRPTSSDMGESVKVLLREITDVEK